MKKTLGVLLAAVLAAAAAQAQGTGNLRYSISVQKFANEAGWSGQWDVGDGFATILTDALQQSGKFIVLGDTEMRQAAMAASKHLRISGPASAKSGRLCVYVGWY